MRDNISAAMRGKAKGARNAMWRGGRTVDSAGYVLVKAPEHPNAMASGYIREHRLVVSRALGRALRDDEHVHHRNGDKTDNRPDNLALVSPGTHQGFHHVGAKRTAATCRRISAAHEALWDEKGRRHKQCEHCGNTFRARDGRKRFCAPACGKAHRHARGWHPPGVGAKISATKRGRS